MKKSEVITAYKVVGKEDRCSTNAVIFKSNRKELKDIIKYYPDGTLVKEKKDSLGILGFKDAASALTFIDDNNLKRHTVIIKIKGKVKNSHVRYVLPPSYLVRKWLDYLMTPVFCGVYIDAPDGTISFYWVRVIGLATKVK